MTDIKINIVRTKQVQSEIPIGYKMFKAKRWPLTEIGLSYEEFGQSTFELVPLWIPETRTFSAITNFSILDNYGVNRLKELQPKDGYELRVKMNWLVDETVGSSPMWTRNTGDWATAVNYEVGTQLWADQIFLASEKEYSLSTSLGFGWYRKVLPFRKIDWFKDPKINPHLFPRVTISRPKGGISNDFGRGEIRTMLQVLDPRDYQFTGNKIPSAFYALSTWCLSV